jgi:hypothetical protein
MRASAQTSKRLRVPVNARAIIGRLNRLLARDGKELRKTRGRAALEALGIYHVIGKSGVVSHHIDDLEQFARESGAIAPYEYLLPEE